MNSSCFDKNWFQQALLGTVAGLLLFSTPLYSQSTEVDPFIEVNRGIYNFNEAFDETLVKPLTKSYDFIMPDLAKRGVSNFFKNLDDINVVFNDLLQLKMRHAMQDSGRLAINTTVGIGGLIDVASSFGLYKNNEDFGQTLGYWGIDSGPYLVMPILGNSTVRDTIGLIPDFLLNPIFWLDVTTPRRALYILETIDSRLYHMSAEALITGDEYTFVRDAYLQRREYLVADGEVVDEWDEF